MHPGEWKWKGRVTCLTPSAQTSTLDEMRGGVDPIMKHSGGKYLCPTQHTPHRYT